MSPIKSLLCISLAVFWALQAPTRADAQSLAEPCRSHPTKTCLLAHAADLAEGISERYSRRSALNSVAMAQDRAGLSREAIETANRIADANYRAKTLSGINARRESERKKALREEGMVMVATVKELLTAGYAGEALDTAQSIEDGDARASAYASIAHAHAKAGRLAAAFGVVERMSPRRSYLAIQVIAPSWGPEGTIAENQRFAEGLTDPNWRDAALSYIAISQARAGRRGDAAQTLRKITEHSFWRATALQEIVQFHSESRHREEVDFWLSRTPDGLQRITAYMRVAENLAKAGDKEAARVWTLRARDGLRRAAASPVLRKQLAHPWGDSGFYVYIMCEQLIALGLLEEAIETAKIHSDRSLHAMVRSLVARKQLAQGKEQEALRTVEGIADPKERKQYRERVRAAIAARQARSGDAKGATETAKTIGNEERSDRALAAAIRAQLKAGDISEALETAKQVSKPDRVLVNIIREEAKAGNFALAIEFTEIIPDVRRRNGELVNIAREQTKAGEIHEAMSTAEKITGTTRYRAYMAIAEALPN